MFLKIKIYPSKNEETGEVTINKFAYHGCEKDLAPALGVQIEVGDGLKIEDCSCIVLKAACY